MTKIVGLYGECEEEEDPAVIVKSIMDGFDLLNRTGYRDLAIATLDEAAIALRLSGYLQGRKSSYRAKQDNDWHDLTTSMGNCKTWGELRQWEIDNQSRLAAMPVTWIEPFREVFEQQKAIVRGTDG